MTLLDALFYWLQMKWIADARPDDGAARETMGFFAQILSEDHELKSFGVDSVSGGKVYATYGMADGTSRTVWFDLEAVEQLGRDMFGPTAGESSDVEDEEETP